MRVMTKTQKAKKSFLKINYAYFEEKNLKKLADD